MLYHYTYTFRGKLNYSFDEKWDFVNGNMGVELFFMISGFVIFMTLDRVRDIGEFVYKRFLRLYPTYWLCLSITFLAIYLIPNTEYLFSKRDIFFNYLMFGGVFHIKKADPSYWSLIPELCFYIMMGLLWYFKLLKKTFLVSLIWLSIIFLNLKIPYVEVLLNFKFGMLFVIGMMCYALRNDKALIYPHLIIFLSLICVYVVRDKTVALFVCFFVLTFYLLIYNKLGFLNFSGFIFLGRISYILYLFHQTIGFLIIGQLIKMGILDYIAIAIMVVISIFFSWLLYKYFEEPMLKSFKYEKIFKNKMAIFQKSK